MSSVDGVPGDGCARLPPEIISQILEELSDFTADMCNCSLVCRTWLPFARHNLHIVIRMHKEPRYSEIIKSPANTFTSTIRTLTLLFDVDLPSYRHIFPPLANYQSLRSLYLCRCSLPDDCPVLPRITELYLWGTKFSSRVSFARFMSGLSAVRVLEIVNNSWLTVGVDQGSFPVFDLDSLTIDCVHLLLTADDLRSFYTPKLILDLCSSAEATAESLRSVSQFLHHLNTHLKYLNLDCDARIGQTCALDFRRNKNIEWLRISNALRLNVCLEVFEVSIHPDLERVLTNILPHCLLQEIILVVETDNLSNPPVWPSIGRLAELLDLAQFATVRTIQFIVDGSPFCLKGSARLARECFEPLVRAAIPSHPNRKIIYVDGEDPDEIWC
ncbi:hypothetical protein B0H10DRAFT_1369737 [Mycena sp. CBHHK59/15]|nr:hypothetical protein B0H10DRAFT_1369737 [Mycena sp. CBHHK59/15]